MTLPLPRHRTMTLMLDLHDDLCRSIYCFGTHEPDTTALLRRRFQDPRLQVIYDVGSNIGYYAITAATMLQPGGEVEAFEPVPWIFERLKINLLSNNLTNLRIHQIAVGQTTGTTTLFLPHGYGAWSTNATLFPKLAKTFNTLFASPGTPIDALEVRTESLDSFIDREGLKPPDLVRIDAEGAELDVLRGMKFTLTKYAPDLVFEVLPDWLCELRSFIKELGYETYRIGPNGWLQKNPLGWDPGSNRDWYATKRPAQAYLLHSDKAGDS